MKEYEVRYTTEYYSNALYGCYASMDLARAAMAEAVACARRNHQTKVADSFKIV